MVMMFPITSSSSDGLSGIKEMSNTGGVIFALSVALFIWLSIKVSNKCNEKFGEESLIGFIIVLSIWIIPFLFYQII